MKISEIIALATHGYKPADIKEVMTKSDSIKTDDIITLVKQGYKPDDISELLDVVKDGEPDEPKDKDKPDEPKDKDKPDEPKDNAEVDSLKKELDDLKSQLKAAQAANARKGREENEEKDEDIIADICRAFM